MDLNLLKWVIIGVLVLIVPIAIMLYLSSRTPADVRGLNAGWREVARRSRIEFTPPKEGALDSARLHGKYRQREVSGAVRIRMAYTGQGARSSQSMIFYTRLEALVENPQRSYLRINTKGSYRKTDQYLGQPVRPLGDPPIDAAFDIKCIPHNLSADIFGHSRTLRAGLLPLAKSRYVEIELKGNAIALEEQGLETRPERLLELFKMICELAETFEDMSYSSGI